jgi:lysosomal acid lipase/cholesteryl ester hydrolase
MLILLIQGLANSLIASCVESSQELLFLVFGRRALLSSVLFYQDIFSPHFYAYMLDKCCALLFNWTGESMSPETKAVVYQHLYSVSSTRAMVHWYDISHSI